MSALPVQLSLAGRHADAVRRWIEGVLGWQPVESETADLVPPRVELVDEAARVPAGSGDDGCPPRILLVDDDHAGPDAAAAAACLAPDAVLGWPSGREHLATVAAGFSDRPGRRGGGQLLRVGGAGGGVGVTTLALAVAGLRAWSGVRTLVAVRGERPTARAVAGAAIADPDLWLRADPLDGVPEARVVRLLDDDVAAVTDPRIEAVVIDQGVAWDTDLLVCRPDATALTALDATTASRFAAVGEGPAPAKALIAAARARRGVALPWSARVARAGYHGRLPASLPGTWLRRLAPLVSDLRTG